MLASLGGGERRRPRPAPGGSRRPGDRLGAVPIGPPLALAASRGPGFGPSPARKWRARGRIEHTLLDEGRGPTPTDLRPSPANRTIPQEVPNVSIYDKEPGYYMILCRILQIDFGEFFFHALR
jgi:hypothetical protein